MVPTAVKKAPKAVNKTEENAKNEPTKNGENQPKSGLSNADFRAKFLN